MYLLILLVVFHFMTDIIAVVLVNLTYLCYQADAKLCNYIYLLYLFLVCGHVSLYRLAWFLLSPYFFHSLLHSRKEEKVDHSNVITYIYSKRINKKYGISNAFKV